MHQKAVWLSIKSIFAPLEVGATLALVVMVIAFAALIHHPAVRGRAEQPTNHATPLAGGPAPSPSPSPSPLTQAAINPPTGSQPSARPAVNASKAAAHPTPAPTQAPAAPVPTATATPSPTNMPSPTPTPAPSPSASIS